MKQVATSLALAASVTFMLAACSTTERHPDRTPSPTSTAAAHEETYNKCIDDRATILASDVERGESIKLGNCAEVSVVGAATQNSTIEIGAVELLVVEADGARVQVGSAERIIVPGSHNEITHTGDAHVEDLGEENSIAAA